MNLFIEVCARCMRHRMSSASGKLHSTDPTTSSTDSNDDNDNATAVADAVKQLAEVSLLLITDNTIHYDYHLSFIYHMFHTIITI